MRVESLLSEVFSELAPDTITALLSGAKLRQLKKREYLIREGEFTPALPILLEGVLRGFLIDAAGQDITDCFAFHPGDVVVGTNALHQPASMSIEALTDCQLLEVPIGAVLDLLAQEPAAGRLYNRLLLNALDRHWQAKLLYRCAAMERYQWFLKNYPGLIDRVNNKHIASFLGMTPVTLSRLRRKLRDRENGAQGGGHQENGDKA